ncbi:MAG: preprotein translocase subunit SecA [Deltaproteobacteria bacterium]|jgi:preprotein translocase subunit SecA|nr:preprotein translocase subunit SecA [Deltaproteobacteria bacterium]
MLKYLIRKILGSKNERYLKRIQPLVKAMNALEERMLELKDEDFPRLVAEYRDLVQNQGRSLQDLRVEVFALVREASRRVLDMRHFDVQLIGGITLDDGKIAEMRTGEGKTLVATLPVVLNAIAGKGVHVVTVNDYLARRDAEWMGRVYKFLGLSVGVIVHGLNDEERKAAYAADITYGTNNEFGFDYLRDNMKFYKEQLVQRGHYYAIVDEVDSILIDEARTPLIISGASGESTELYRKIDAIIPRLKMEEHFTVDEKVRSAMLTEAGVSRAESLLGVDNLFDAQNVTLQHHVLQALKAHNLFKRDVDYIVNEGQVVIVDEFTGRLMPGRRFSDGLHQALEAKEKVKVEAENQTLASITFQNYFRLYEKLAGMTGTADTEAVEFQEIYRLEVISIPTHKPMIRIDAPDQVYRTKTEKYAAIAESIRELHQKGQPVLVGTISIEISELLSGMLKKIGIPHNVLNAKQHEKEAAIIAEAGQKAHVTIATNMAGRGTDIVLGEGVRELGGLHILGTERHESRRIDNQLRGRSGRQGDPGSSRFYIALEDDLMRLFGADKHMKLMQTLGLKEGESIEHPLISRGIATAQKRVEGHNFEIRKSLLDFDNVMNQQREVIYSLRRDAMFEDDVDALTREFITDVLDSEYAPVLAAKGELEDEQADLDKGRLQDLFNLSRIWPRGFPDGKTLPDYEEARDGVFGLLDELKTTAPELYVSILRYFLLEEIDRCWKEHLLTMDQLRDGIGLRGYGQRDPKQEYKREGFNLFHALLDQIKENVCRDLTRARIKVEQVAEAGGQERSGYTGSDATPEDRTQEGTRPEQRGKKPGQFKHKESKALSYSSGGSANPAKPATVKRETPKVGRNDDCPCGSGKKYKKCCGANK